MGASFDTTGSPEVVELPRLLDDLSEGYTVIPRLSGEWRWSNDDRLELLRSVRDGLPIGAPLMWRTRLRLPRHHHIAERTLAEAPNGALVQHVLDGMHRLVTLWAAFASPRQEHRLRQTVIFSKPEIGSPGGADILDGMPHGVALDLMTGEFAFEEAASSPWHMPLHLAFDGRELRRFQRNLERHYGMSDRLEHMLRQSDEYSSAVSRYRIPLMVLATDRPDKLGNAIQRLSRPAHHIDEILLARTVYDVRIASRSRPPRERAEVRAHYEASWDVDSTHNEARLSEITNRLEELHALPRHVLRRQMEKRLSPIEVLVRRVLDSDPAPRDRGWAFYFAGQIAEWRGEREEAGLLYDRAMRAWPTEPRFAAAAFAVGAGPDPWGDVTE